MTLTFVTSERAVRHIAHATCPKCETLKLGITFHGVLSSGRKVYELAAHSPRRRAVRNKEGRCEGSGVRMEVTESGWSPIP